MSFNVNEINTYEIRTMNDKISQIYPPMTTSGQPRRATRNETTRRQQLSIQSTFDADIVLRKVVEDRSSILALKNRELLNETELMKARARQIQLEMELDQQEQEILELAARAKRDIEDFSIACKKYINTFILAFDNGDIYKQPRHPLLPSTKKLEAAVSKCKATFIEKAQIDDWVNMLELERLQNQVPDQVVKMNEQAFHQAVDIARYQLREYCGAWANHVKELLSDVHPLNEKTSLVTEKKHPLATNNRLQRETNNDGSNRGSLKRPIDLLLSREQTDTKLLKKRALNQGHQIPRIDLSSDSELRIPYQRDDFTKALNSDKVQHPTSDEVSVAELLTQMGR